MTEIPLKTDAKLTS